MLLLLGGILLSSTKYLKILKRNLLGNLLQPMSFERLGQVGHSLGCQKSVHSLACSLSSLAWLLDLVPVPCSCRGL